MHLPNSPHLPTRTLNACFTNTTSSYKYFWFLTLLQFVEDGREKISKHEMFSGMLSNAWPIVLDSTVSLGSYDQTRAILNQLKRALLLEPDFSSEKVYETLAGMQRVESRKVIWILDKYVPYLFLTPWFPKKTGETDREKEQRTELESQMFKDMCLYALYSDHIRVNPDWVPYLIQHSEGIKRFCIFHFSSFLEKRNPDQFHFYSRLEKLYLL